MITLLLMMVVFAHCYEECGEVNMSTLMEKKSGLEDETLWLLTKNELNYNSSHGYKYLLDGGSTCKRYDAGSGEEGLTSFTTTRFHTELNKCVYSCDIRERISHMNKIASILDTANKTSCHMEALACGLMWDYNDETFEQGMSAEYINALNNLIDAYLNEREALRTLKWGDLKTNLGLSISSQILQQESLWYNFKQDYKRPYFSAKIPKLGKFSEVLNYVLKFDGKKNNLKSCLAAEKHTLKEFREEFYNREGFVSFALHSTSNHAFYHEFASKYIRQGLHERIFTQLFCKAWGEVTGNKKVKITKNDILESVKMYNEVSDYMWYSKYDGDVRFQMEDQFREIEEEVRKAQKDYMKLFLNSEENHEAERNFNWSFVKYKDKFVCKLEEKLYARYGDRFEYKIVMGPIERIMINDHGFVLEQERSNYIRTITPRSDAIGTSISSKALIYRFAKYYRLGNGKFGSDNTPETYELPDEMDVNWHRYIGSLGTENIENGEVVYLTSSYPLSTCTMETSAGKQRYIAWSTILSDKKYLYKLEADPF